MREVFEKIFNEYLIEKEKPEKGNRLYGYLTRSECKENFYRTKIVDRAQYIIKSSAGNGNWVVVPWICVFDKDITTTARKGFYIVYLFSADMKRVYLSLNQGWTFFKDAYGSKKGKDVINKVAEMWKTTLQSGLNEFSFEDIDLAYTGHTTKLPKGYELGHICGKCYEADNLPENEVLIKDLQNMLTVYRELKGKMVDGSVEKTINHLVSEYEIGSIEEIKSKKSEQSKLVDNIIANGASDSMLDLKSDLPDFVIEIPKGRGKSGNGRGPVDYVVKAERQGKLGLAGELMVIEYEKRKLNELNINKKVEHISKEMNDSEGYDIKSYDEKGKEIHIEVKTTKGGINTPFYLTAAELKHCQENLDKYKLYRVYNFDLKENKGELYIIEGDLDEKMCLEPQTYMVKGRKRKNN